MLCKPNLFLVGAPKAGTTSVCMYLKSHPQIFVPEIKEPNFFLDVGPNCPTADKIKDKEKYLRLFEKGFEFKYRADCSVSYLHSMETPQMIKNEIDDAKILIILRNPYERLYSHWLMDVREGYQKHNFVDAIKNDIKTTKKGFCYSHMYIECSLYYESVNRYLELFGKQNVLVLLYDDLKVNPKLFVTKILNFLNVDETSDLNFNKNYNVAGVPRNSFYQALFHNMKLRMIAKKYLPSNFRSILRGIITKQVNSKPNSYESIDYNFLIPYFENDISNTEKLINVNLEQWKRIKN